MRNHAFLAIGIVFFAMMMGFLATNFGVTLLTTNTVTDETASYSGLDPDIFADESSLALLRGCTENQILKVNASNQYACAEDSTTAVTGAGTVALDLADDDSNESDALSEIAITGDTNSIFTEPTADKLLIAAANNWPSADTADALSANPTDCAASNFANAIAASGNLTCAQVAFSDLSGTASDAQIPNSITIDLATSATNLAADPTDCAADTKADSIDAQGNLTCTAVDTGDITNNTILPVDLSGNATFADEECITYESTGPTFEGQSCGSGSSIVLDLGADGSNESTALATIQTTGAGSAIFSEPSADVFQIDTDQDWPNAATATALAANPSDCGANEFANAIAASGNLTCAQVAFSDLSGTASDAQIPNNITINLAAAATALAADPTDCGANEFANAIAASGNLTCAQVAFSDLFGSATDGQIPDTITINLAATATAFASNPDDCSAGQFAHTIGTTGSLTCSQVAFSDLSGTASDAQIPDTITIDLAATATALAANGANCSAGSAPLGVDASGAAESCTDYVDVTGDTMVGTLSLTGSGTELRFYETGGGTDYISFAATGSLTSTTALTWAVNGACTGTNEGALTVDDGLNIVCTDDDSGAGATGTVNRVEEDNVQVGGADIVTIDFGSGFDVAESPDTEVNITFDITELSIPSADLATALTDETGTGVVVYDTSPTLNGTVTITGAASQFRLDWLDCSGLANGGTLSVTASGVVHCQADDGGGSSLTLDLADDDANESTALSEIATTGDTNSIFTEPTDDKLLIDAGQNWPTADAADALSNNPDDCTAGEYAHTIGVTGSLVCSQVAFSDLSGTASDAQVPNNITIDLAATATAFASNPDDCTAGQFAHTIGTTGSLVCSAVDFTDLSGTASDAQIPNTITIDLAATATALAANPDDCTAGEFAHTIGTTGSLVCSAVAFTDLSGTASDAQIPNTITIDLAATATALASNPDDCTAGQFAHTIGTTGSLSCAQVQFSDLGGAATDAQIPNDITINTAGTADALTANGANCSAGSAPLGVDAAGAAESCTDFVDVTGDTMTGNLVMNATLEITGSGNQLRFYETGGGTDYVSLAATGSLTSTLNFVLSLTGNCSGFNNGGALTIDSGNNIVCSNDDSTAGGGTLSTLEEEDAQVGGSDIVTLDFRECFDLAESPDTEVNVTWDPTECSLTDDSVWLGSSGGLAAEALLTGCSAADNAVTYATASNSFGCNTLLATFARSSTYVVCANNTLDTSNCDYTGDGTADEVEIEAAIAALPALGGTIYLAQGSFSITSCIDIDTPMILEGTGQRGTQIITSDTSIDMICVADDNPVVIRDLRIRKSSAGTAGAGIVLDGGSGGTWNQDSVISNVRFDNQWNSIDTLDSADWRIFNSQFASHQNYGVWARNTVDPDAGDHLISGNSFSSAASVAHIQHEGSGGLRVVGNKLIQGDYGIRLEQPASQASSIMIVGNNSIENFTDGAIYLTHGASGTFHQIQITGNQINTQAGGATATVAISGSGIETIAIAGNNFRTPTNGTALNLTGVNRAVVSGNTFRGTGTNDTAINVDAAASFIRIGVNSFELINTEITLDPGCTSCSYVPVIGLPTDDTVQVGDGTELATTTLPDCAAVNDAVTYTTSSNSIGCNTFYEEKNLVLAYHGTLAATSSGGPTVFRVFARTSGTIKDVHCNVVTAPTGQAVIVDINLDGTTIFTTQSNRPQIAAGTNDDTSGAPDVTSYNAGQYFDFDIDQVGSGTPGSHLVCGVRVREALFNTS